MIDARGRPNFTAAQRTRLQRLGVLAEQCDELRITLHALPPMPVDREMERAALDVLAQLANHGDVVATLLERIATRADLPAALALDALREPAAAVNRVRKEVAALAGLARNSNRNNARSPRPDTREKAMLANAVREIDQALLRGWTKANGLPHGRISDRSAAERAADRARAKAARKVPHVRRFQPDLWPSESEARPFFEIVQICFEAAGVNCASPKSAIRTYLKCSLDRHMKLAAAIFQTDLNGKPRRR